VEKGADDRGGHEADDAGAFSGDGSGGAADEQVRELTGFSIGTVSAVDRKGLSGTSVACMLSACSC
jgi:hypothetical protein